MDYNKRWYDYNKDMVTILELVEGKPQELIDSLAESIFSFTRIVRDSISEQEEEQEIPVTIGKEKILGYYKSFNRRRWYDKNWTILSIMNLLSTLPQNDFDNVARGTLQMLKELGVSKND